MANLITPGEELRIYRGKDFKINDYLSIHIPSLGEICDFDESKYFSFVHQITATPTDMCVQLWDHGIDYTTISDFQLFYHYIAPGISPENSSILFGDIDFSKFQLVRNPINNEPILLHPSRNWFIDEFTYEFIVSCIREIHFFKKNVAIPGNAAFKEALIEDTREAALMQQNKESHSYLLNMISTMVNIEGFKYNHEEVWSMKINAFMDSVMRIGKIKNASLLLQSGYSGFGINLKEINNKQLDWMGSLRD